MCGGRAVRQGDARHDVRRQLREVARAQVFGHQYGIRGQVLQRGPVHGCAELGKQTLAQVENIGGAPGEVFVIEGVEEVAEPFDDIVGGDGGAVALVEDAGADGFEQGIVVQHHAMCGEDLCHHGDGPAAQFAEFVIYGALRVEKGLPFGFRIARTCVA